MSDDNNVHACVHVHIVAIFPIFTLTIHVKLSQNCPSSACPSPACPKSSNLHTTTLSQWTYLDSKLVCAELVQNGIIISACKIIVPSLLLRYFSFFISLGILRSTWEFLEPNLGNSRKVEWQHYVYCLDVYFVSTSCGSLYDRIAFLFRMSSTCP